MIPLKRFLKILAFIQEKKNSIYIGHQKLRGTERKCVIVGVVVSVHDSPLATKE